MSFADTVSQDFKITDATQTVTYVAVREAGDETYTVHFAAPRVYSAEEQLANQGLINASDREWGLGTNQFPDGFKPQAGDKITDEDGVDYYLSGKVIKRDSFKIAWTVHTTEGQGQ